MNYKKRYVNPKIRKLKPKKKIWKKPFFWIVIVFIVAISSFCFVLFYPAIQISDIEISGNQKIKTQDIENEVMSLVNKKLINLGFLNVSSKSILLASTGNIENKITENFPEVKSVQVKKEFLNKIIVSIEERGATAVFCNSSTDCFLLDRDGVVFEKAMQIPDDLPVLSKQYFEIGVSLGDNVIPKETVDLIYKVQHILLISLFCLLILSTQCCFLHLVNLFATLLCKL